MQLESLLEASSRRSGRLWQVQSSLYAAACCTGKVTGKDSFLGSRLQLSGGFAQVVLVCSNLDAFTSAAPTTITDKWQYWQLGHYVGQSGRQPRIEYSTGRLQCSRSRRCYCGHLRTVQVLINANRTTINNTDFGQTGSVIALSGSVTGSVACVRQPQRIPDRGECYCNMKTCSAVKVSATGSHESLHMIARSQTPNPYEVTVSASGFGLSYTSRQTQDLIGGFPGGFAPLYTCSCCSRLRRNVAGRHRPTLLLS